MNERRTKNQKDWEEFGFQTMLTCNDEGRTIEICGLHLHAYEDEVQPVLSRLASEIEHNRSRYNALHDHLYDRPIPVNDAAMLTHSWRTGIVFTLCLVTAVACFAGNLTTFLLMGWIIILAFLAAAGMTALPLAVGHLAFE